jgi:hypothetical protein
MDYDPEKNAEEANRANWEAFSAELEENDQIPVLFSPAGTRKIIDNSAVFRVYEVYDKEMFKEGYLYQAPFRELAMAASPDDCQIWASEVVRMCGDLDTEVFFKLICRIADNYRQSLKDKEA